MENWTKIEYLLEQRRLALDAKSKYKQGIWENLKTLRKYLDPREYKLLVMRLRDFKDLETCGKEFGVTRERIRQMEAKAIEKLKI